MEENDLPDFDADDLLAAMAEELQKDEAALMSQPSDKTAPEEDSPACCVPDQLRSDDVLDSGINDPLQEIEG